MCCKHVVQACGAELKHLETFHGGTHNDTWTRYGYYEHINKFIGYVSGWKVEGGRERKTELS